MVTGCLCGGVLFCSRVVWLLFGYWMLMMVCGWCWSSGLCAVRVVFGGLSATVLLRGLICGRWGLLLKLMFWVLCWCACGSGLFVCFLICVGKLSMIVYVSRERRDYFMFFCLFVCIVEVSVYCDFFCGVYDFV